MSLILMAQAMKMKVGNPLRKLVLIKLADNANDEGKCWPSHSHIADHCEISSRSVMNHVKALEKAMFLTVEHRVKDNKKQSNMYHLHFEKALISSEGDSLPSGAGDSLPKQISSEGDSLPPAGDSLPSSAGDSHRTSHSLEPVNESLKNKQKNFIELPSFISTSQWAEIQKIKKAACKVAMTDRARTQLANNLLEIHEAGYSMEQVLNLWSEYPHWRTMSLEYMISKLANVNHTQQNAKTSQRDHAASTSIQERVQDLSWADGM